MLSARPASSWIRTDSVLDVESDTMLTLADRLAAERHGTPALVEPERREVVVADCEAL
jgi:hypothetical protein